MDPTLHRRQKRAASVRFYARIEEEDGACRCVRYRLLLLPPSAGMVDRILQRLPQVHIAAEQILQCHHTKDASPDTDRSRCYSCTATTVQTQSRAHCDHAA